jgi:membrane protein required for colicin V production
MEILGKLNWIDLAIVLVLAAGAFAGFTQGLIRYALSWVAILLAFIVAAQLKGPVADLLNFWQAFTPIVREFWIFIGLFVGLSVAGWFIVRAFYRTTRVPILKQLDEIGGALLGLLFAATFIVLQLVVMDSLFRPATQLPGSEVGGLRGYYEAMNDSILVGFFRDTIIPTAGFVIRPFVPSDIAAILRLK